MRFSLILVVSLTMGFFAPSDAAAKKAPPSLPAISSSRFPNRLLSMTRRARSTKRPPRIQSSSGGGSSIPRAGSRPHRGGPRLT